jgi:DNA transformation protein
MSSFNDYVIDQMSLAGKISIKSMFGGYGVYCSNLIVGIIVNDILFLKVGESNKDDYLQRGMPPFTYLRKGAKAASMSYYQVPEEILENKEDLLEWTRKSFIESKKAKSSRKKVTAKKKNTTSKKKSVSKKK